MPLLQLALPWVRADQTLEGLDVRPGEPSALVYDDEITLAVELLDPADYGSIDELLGEERRVKRPGVVTLVVGAIPVPWRAALRQAEVSFIDVSGVAEIRWPRVAVSTGQFARPAQRRRSPLPIQKGNALVIHEVVIAGLRGERPTIGGLAERADVGMSTASRAITQLAEHGLVRKHRVGPSINIEVPDPAAIAELLVQRTGWPQGPTMSGYVWGANPWEVASVLSERAHSHGLAVAITGRTALSYLGVLSTSSPPQIRCWLASDRDDLDRIARQLELEPAPEEDSNVALAADPWSVGVHGRAVQQFDRWHASIAHPLRVWCDLHDEPRGTEFAVQIWKDLVSNG